MRAILTAIWALGLCDGALGVVTSSALFSDHAVLQRDLPIPVWGTAAAGEKVSVSVASRTAEATADAEGRWMVRLEPLAAGGPHEITIRGSNTLTIKDVLVGEVWVAGGQSNMEMKLSKCEGGEAAAATASDTQIRVFRVGGSLKSAPSRELNGNWQLCTPENAKDWSAAGYFFAQDLRKSLGVSVGLVQNAVGWTPAEAWTSRKTLSADAELKRAIVDRYDRWQSALPKAQEIHAAQLAEWKEMSKKLAAEGKPTPPEPPAPQDVSQFTHCASVLFNGMLHPLIPYGIRGTIWYQIPKTNAKSADAWRSPLRSWHTARKSSPRDRSTTRCKSRAARSG